MYVREIAHRTGQVVPGVFCYPDGRPITHPEQSFKRAAKAADRPGLLIHDLRRSGVVYMYEDLNMAESTIMDLCGMKTASIFERYNIRGRKQRKAAGENRRRLQTARTRPPGRRG